MSDVILDVTDANFAVNVLDASRERPVVVDFWAPWCGPCQVLRPLLERLAEESGGEFRLAKVNVDENPGLSRQFQVRGVPAVKAFYQGRIIDEFTGALPDSSLRTFLARIIPSPSEKLRSQAASRLETGDPASARQLLEQSLATDRRNDQARLDLARLLLDQHEVAPAREILQEVSPLVKMDDPYRQLEASFKFLEQADAAPSAQVLQDRIAGNGNDLEARLALANLWVAQGDYAPALEQLLEIVRHDRNFQDDIGRKTMLDVFQLARSQPELVSQYRRLLARHLH